MSTRRPCTLLTLPPGIRNQIWRCVLGGRLIRIGFCGCDSPSPKQPDHFGPHHPFVRYMTDISLERNNEILSLLIIDRTTRVCGRWDCITPIESSLSRLLLVNRQISQEAAPILYTTNIFSFQNPNHASAFISILTAKQCSLIKAIQVPRVGRLAETPAPLPLLPALDTIHIQIPIPRKQIGLPNLRFIKELAARKLRAVQRTIETKRLRVKKIRMSIEMLITGDVKVDEGWTSELEESKLSLEELIYTILRRVKELSAGEDTASGA